MFNVLRDLAEPKSLLAKTKYDDHDVYAALSTIFFDKCYICETKEPQDVNVEHFVAHKGDPEKKFQWSNLYLACSRCNNIKGSGFDVMLDCCDPGVDVFHAIKHVVPTSRKAKGILLVAMRDDPATLSTRDLLDKVYNNDHTPTKKVSAAFLRSKIYTQYNILSDLMNDYYSLTATDGEKELALEKMSILIKRSAPYSAFIRWVLLEDAELCELLEGLMD